jgi:excisionase family DNA binding protein
MIHLKNREPQKSDGIGRAIDLLTIKEVAGLLRLSVSGMRHLHQKRYIPFIKVGGIVRFSKQDVINYLNKVRVEATR